MLWCYELDSKGVGRVTENSSQGQTDNSEVGWWGLWQTREQRHLFNFFFNLDFTKLNLPKNYLFIIYLLLYLLIYYRIGFVQFWTGFLKSKLCLRNFYKAIKIGKWRLSLASVPLEQPSRERQTEQLASFTQPCACGPAAGHRGKGWRPTSFPSSPSSLVFSHLPFPLHPILLQPNTQQNVIICMKSIPWFTHKSPEKPAMQLCE